MLKIFYSLPAIITHTAAQYYQDSFGGYGGYPAYAGFAGQSGRPASDFSNIIQFKGRDQ